MTVIDSSASSVVILKWRAGWELYEVLRRALFIRPGTCKGKLVETLGGHGDGVRGNFDDASLCLGCLVGLQEESLVWHD